MSRSIAILIAALASTARAESGSPASSGSEVEQAEPAYPPPAELSEVEQPAPAYPPPPPVYGPQVVQPLPRPPRPLGPSGFERRHHAGAQLGGSGIFQLVYRFHADGPVYLETGLFGADHGANVSAGVVLGKPVANRWFPYVGFGGGFMFGAGPPPKEGCDPTMTTCPEKTGTSFPYLHARAGIGCAFGGTRRNLVSLDVGGWYGKAYDTWNDTAHNTINTSKMVLTPMAGVSYFFAIR